MRVAIGPVFDNFGGVSQHIFAIKRYSSHKVIEIPSEFTRTILNKIRLGTELYRNVMNKIKLKDYNVVHSHADPWFTNLCLSSRTDTCRWVHTYHTLYFKEDYPDGLTERQEEINRYLVEIAPKADIRISISKWLHDYLSETYSIQTNIIPNGFDLEKCDKANPDRFIEKYAIQDFILFVGNIQPVKNPQLFVELAIRMPEFKFLMIGKRLNRANLVSKYGVSIPKNLILMGEMSHESVLDAMASCKTFVMTSKHEGIPTALLEAMGTGKPVVVPAHSGCKEVVQSDDYGFLYKPGSLDDLIDKVKQALISNHIGEKARKRVSKDYDWRVLAKKIDSMYESCY